MATNSAIEWTESTWNPVTGCTKVSAGCAHCYAERMARRLQAIPRRDPEYQQVNLGLRVAKRKPLGAEPAFRDGKFATENQRQRLSYDFRFIND